MYTNINYMLFLKLFKILLIELLAMFQINMVSTFSSRLSLMYYFVIVPTLKKSLFLPPFYFESKTTTHRMCSISITKVASKSKPGKHIQSV